MLNSEGGAKHHNFTPNVSRIKFQIISNLNFSENRFLWEIEKLLQILRKCTLDLFVVMFKALQKSSNVSYVVFSHFRVTISLNFFRDFRTGILTTSCSSESVAGSMIGFWPDDGSGRGGAWSVSDFLCFRGITVAVATNPEVRNFILLVASNVGTFASNGFLIFALELFVFLARCEMMSAVSTILWNVDL